MFASEIVSRARTIERLMAKYQCSREAVHKYLDLLEQGYSQTQALDDAGIEKPHEDE